jgi:uncharacterized protein YebE (UPF0316 family)
VEAFLLPQAWLSAVLIFFLRVSDMSLDTLRVLVVMRGRKGAAWAFGFCQSLIFVLAIGHIHMRIVSPRLGNAIAENLRGAGYAVTEVPGRGKDGMVTVLDIGVLRKNVDWVRRITNQVDPDAFITAEDVRPVRRGFWRA